MFAEDLAIERGQGWLGDNLRGMRPGAVPGLSDQPGPGPVNLESLLMPLMDSNAH